MKNLTRVRKVGKMTRSVVGQVIYDAYHLKGIKVSIVRVKNETVKLIALDELSPTVEEYIKEQLNEKED